MHCRIEAEFGCQAAAANGLAPHKGPELCEGAVEVRVNPY